MWSHFRFAYFCQVDFGQERGIKMLSWGCQPQNMYFPDSGALHLQTKTFLSQGELGKPGSIYAVESVVKQNSGVVCYEGAGSFILEPVEFLRMESRRAVVNKDFDAVWKRLSKNASTVSRDELYKFVCLSEMVAPDSFEADQKE